MIYSSTGGFKFPDGTTQTKWAASSATAATQTEQEAGSSITVMTTPGRQQYHPSAAKAWVRFDASSGSPVITASYNVSSITDNGAGNFTLNFTTAFSAATSYVCIGNAGGTGGGGGDFDRGISFQTYVNAYVIFYTGSPTDGAKRDWSLNQIVCYGDQ